MPNLTEWTIEQVNLFRGSISSLLRNDGYNFLFLGLFIERADNSARLLDVKYFVLLPKPKYIGGNIDNIQWSILLRSLSSFRAFRWAYDGNVTATKIADFLVLNRDCSRSLSFCIQNIVDHLINLKCSPLKVDKIYQTIKDLNASIQQEKIEAIIDYGLHEFVSQFIKKISSVDRDIQKEFFY